VNDLIRPNHGTDQQVVRSVVAAVVLSVRSTGGLSFGKNAKRRTEFRSSHGCRVIDRKSCTTYPAVAPEVGAAA
jgi:hypothetical protein